MKFGVWNPLRSAEMIDGIAEPAPHSQGDADQVEVALQRELGHTDKYKLYVTINGQTVLRICKLERGMLDINMEL